MKHEDLQRADATRTITAALAAALTAALWLGLGAVYVTAAAAARADDAATAGQRIYRKQCAACHGDAGQGVKGTKGEYPNPLIGEKSADQLARYIERWMPDEDAKACVGQDAQQVARYVYDAFYSPIAQARNRPPRIDLVRLTVPQYRNAVADLVAGFGPAPPSGDEHGLRGQYFNSREPRRRRAVERIDPQVMFDFGKANPAPDKLTDPKGYSVRWQGALFAPDTGQYEMIVRTDHAARLWVNDLDEPLIDRWVKSGSDTEFRASIFLVGGRAYPLRLEFSSHQQGVNDKDKQGRDVQKAFVELAWKPPKRAAEVIASRYLSPIDPPAVYVAATPFPPDDRSVGYERGTSVSKAWAEGTTDAALSAARYVADHLREFADISRGDDDNQRRDKARRFCGQFVQRAFRRPLADELRQLYVDRQFADAPDVESAVKRVVILALKSPRFLYLAPPSDKPDGYDVAEQLAFTLWDSLPDQALLDAAAAGKLTTRQQVSDQARRMLDDPRAHGKVRQFFDRWLLLKNVDELAKDPALFPDFNETLASDLRTSLELFLDDVVWSDKSDFRQLLTSHDLYLNGRLGKFYGYDLPEDAPFQKVSALRPQRLGVLSHPYMMAGFAHMDVSSPIHRGVFLVRAVLGRALRPPPQAVAPLPPDLHPDLSTRQRVTLQTQAKTCQACHGMINALGFTLEHFDAVGRFRDNERDKPIDATGFYILPSGDQQQFTGVDDLARFLSGSEEVHRSFVIHLFHHLVKQPIYAYGPEVPETLRHDFAAGDVNIRHLIIDIATTAALHTGKPSAAE